MNDKPKYLFGTHYKLFYGRCYCIKKENWIGNYVTIYETDNKNDWERECSLIKNM